jgi:choline kinase
MRTAKKKSKKRPYKKKAKINIIPEQNKLISVVILSDLPGYRMKSYGPNCLIQLNKKLLIDLQIEAIKKTFVNYEIIICVGFDAEKICKYIRHKYQDLNIRIVENQMFNSCNSCESLRLGINNTMNNNILIIDGGLLFDKKVLTLIDRDTNCVIVEKTHSENLEIGVNTNLENKSQHFSFGGYKTWSEILYIKDNQIIETFKKFLNHPDSKKKFIFELLNDALKNRHEILCIENKHKLYKINNIKTYHHIKDNYEIFNF